MLMKRGGRLGLDTERIAQKIELATGSRRRKRQGDATAWELAINHHLGYQRDSHARRNHLGNRGELGPSECQLRPKIMGRQKFTNLGRQAMHFV